MSKFSARACTPPSRAAKRPADDAAVSSQAAPARPKGKQVPRASEIVVVEQAPRPQKQVRLPTSAPVVVCVYLVSESAADVWASMYENATGVSVWQVQLDHAARPNVLYDQVSSWNDFLKKTHDDDETVPASLRELQDQCGCKLVIADSTDPDAVGFVQWRTAWYVAGEDHSAIDNFLGLLNDWLSYKQGQSAKELPFEVRLHPHLGIQTTAADDFENWSVEEQAATLPLPFFAAQPVQGKRVVSLNLECEGDNVSVLISGNTWSYRSKLDALGVAGAYHEGATEKDKTYFRVMKNLHAMSDKGRLLDLLGKACFKNLALRVVVDKQPEAGSAAAALIAELEEMPQLHFVKASDV